MAKTRDEIINAVKEQLYSKLSYTSQTYEEILLETVSLFKDDDKLATEWNNISEADIMFIFMSLLAAHKDILNYMLDYRVQEAFMSTAKERQSVIRVCNSFGYKPDSYKAARAEFTVTLSGSQTINPFDSFVDDDGISWVYIGEQRTFNDAETIELFQGLPISLKLVIGNFSNKVKSHEISAQPIAIGNNFNAEGCSRLSYGDVNIPTTLFDEVNNLYSYTGSNQDVYMLNVSPLGVTYIKLHKFIDIAQYADDAEFTFQYITTSGADVTSAATFTSTPFGAGSATLTPVVDSFIPGSNAPGIDELKENFKTYYASATSLVTLEDYENFVMSVQKTVPEITKCVVVDQQDNSRGEAGEAGMNQLDVAVYALKETVDNNGVVTYNDPLTTGVGSETEALAELLNAHNVTGITVYVNSTDGATANALANVGDMTVALTTSAILSDAEKSEIQTIIYDLIKSKDIGESITEADVNTALSNYGYNYFYNGIVLTNNTALYYQYVDITTIDNITFTLV